MKFISFYLPQFHPIKENNEWWGNGFTEWTNVSKAQPKFRGHYQPHIPADLGFYDLRLEETRIAQAELAKQYGIGGFCYYHYWFNGKMLLERPFNEVLESGKPDFPFCLCWANENWSRRWDGMEQELLMAQNYEEYDAVQHMNWLVKALKDKRYIKVAGKPLFLIYRAQDIPDISGKIALWREVVAKSGLPGIYICSVKNFKNTLSDAESIKLGFDACVEFQPNPKSFPKRIFSNFAKYILQRIYNKVLDTFKLESLAKFPVIHVFDYKSIVENAMRCPQSVHKVFPCIMPYWDNSARKKNDATIIQNDDPELYATWLYDAAKRVSDYNQDEQLVFINAWNEWAEGCHLEPDLRNGKKFLEATKQVLDQFNQRL